MPELITILGVLSGSTAAIFVRWSTAPSIVLVAYRMGITALLLSPSVFLHRKELFSAQRNALLLSLGGGCILGLHFAAFFRALRMTSINICTVLANLTVIFVAFGTTLVFRQRLSRRAWFAIFIALAGAVMVTFSSERTGIRSLSGCLLAVLAALFLAIYTMVGSICRRSLSTTLYTFLAYSAAAVTAALLCLASRTPLTGHAPINWLTALGMAVFCTMLGHSVVSWSLKYLPAPFVSTVQLLDSVFSTLWGMLLFREIPSITALLGGALCIIGIALYSQLTMNKETISYENDHSNHK